MSQKHTVTRKIKVIEARYVKEAESIAILGECEEGRLTNQIHKNCFSYGNRSEQEIEEELHKTAALLVGKEINLIFDPNEISLQK